MSLPPPTPHAPAATPAPGWYADPWDTRALRWWDGSAWTGYTDAYYGGHAGSVGPAAASAVSALVGPTRWLARALPIGVLLQTVGLALSWSSFREVMERVRDNQLDALGTTRTSGTAALGQALSLAGVIVLVLRMVWLHRATLAAIATGGSPRRSPGLACCGWLIPIVNFWWPLQGMQDVCPNDARTRRRIGWWWTTYLFGALGGVAGLFMIILAPVAVAVATTAVSSLSIVVSALIERRLVEVALAEQAARVGLNLTSSEPTDA